MEKLNIILKYFVAVGLMLGLSANAMMAQSGQRYAEPVFDEVNVETGIPYSSAIREGETSPTTLCLDFYEPAGDTFQARPLVITVFGGAFIAGSRDFVDMQTYCTRLAQHGYVAASIDYRLLSVLHLSRTALVREGYMAAQDVSSAVRFFKAHSEEYRIDTSNVFLLGNSAGSIAILCELFMDEGERSAETFESPELGSMHSSGYEEYAGFSPSVAGAIPQWGGVIDVDLISAEEYVPLCMIHGTEDTHVPYDSGYCYSSTLSGLMPYMYGSHAIANHLDEIGISDYEFHPFEGEEHCFYLTQYTFQFIEEKCDTCFNIVRDFLFRHLDQPQSVLEIARKEIQVYPNPATDFVTIRMGEVLMNESRSLIVLDVMGRIMFSERKANPQMTIDVSQWPSGVYFVRIEQDGVWSVRKFVKR